MVKSCISKENGLPGYIDAKGNCLTFPHGDMQAELVAYELAKVSFIKGHFGTSEGAVAGWDVRGRGQKEDEKGGGDKMPSVKLEPGNGAFSGKINIQQANAKDFVAARDKMPTELKAFLTPYTPEEYDKAGVKLFMEKDGKGGFGIKGEEGISLFSAPGAHMGSKLMDAAIENGMKKLDCFGKKLLKFYAKKGFRVTKVDKWDDQYKPAGWDTDKFGKPNIYYMELKGKHKTA